jgi:hypothetical protein
LIISVVRFTLQQQQKQLIFVMTLKFVLLTALVAITSAKIQERFFTQRLNHFDPAERRTWEMVREIFHLRIFVAFNLIFLSNFLTALFGQ